MSKAVKSAEKQNWLNRQHAIAKLLLCMAFAAGIPFLFIEADIASRIMLGWDVFCFCLLILYWLSFFTTPHTQIRRQAAQDDPSRVIIFIIVLVCSAASMLAIILLLTEKNETSPGKALHVPLALAGMILSWITVHTLFTARYAHMYYGNHESKPDTHQGGLDFPNDQLPDFLDFAYFSFVIGMTFQVSDVDISSKKVRKLALLHGFISFIYNTIIVALTINIIVGLKDG
ncbi:DUF1345 domain-containing protein [Terrimonas sp.]|uniref:DUF1345 domain-containing protein n=1 Tax=Terrimonas sp. TaxID=1914338 RepID=UPI000D5147CA|nr:DUF1345 domain-containing protein [Terrimonas sp.]PVD53674.1 DUF1345 domain-containing protein [Terrimonas sp.]